jgi:WD40 repeat protein
VVALSDGRRVVSGSKDKTLRVWDVDTGECVRELKGHGGVSGC